MRKLRSTTVPASFILFLVMFFSSGCEKTEISSRKIQGLWTGEVGNSRPGSNQFYALSIKPDGKLTFEGYQNGQEQFGAGTWTLSGSDFVADVTTLYGFPQNIGIVQRLTAKFNSADGRLTEGKYVVTGIDVGYFNVTKVE